MSEILVTPNPLLIATGVEGLIEVGGVVSYVGKPQGAYPEDFLIGGGLTYDASGVQYVRRNSAADGTMTRIERVLRNQPLWMNMNLDIVRPFHQSVAIALFDDLGGNHNFFAYSNANDGGGWHFYVTANGTQVLGGVGGITTHPHTNLALQTNGNQILFMRQADGFWRTEYVYNLPVDVTEFTMHYNLFEVGTVIKYVQQRIDDADIPVTTNLLDWDFRLNPHNFVARQADNTHIGILAEEVGTAQLKLMVPRTTVEKLVNIEASALYIRPKNGSCGDIVIQGQVIEFESNGGQGGIFEASGGTILAGLKWQAPYTEGEVIFTYTIGNVTAYCNLQVVKKLTVEGVDEDGYYPDLAQGEIVQFHASCFRSTWESDPPNLVIQSGVRRGFMTAPTDAQDEVFGYKEVTITVRGCGQVYSFKVRIQPMYPTPRFCGAMPLKWLQNEPDFLPNRLTMSGGTSQVKNRNKEGILTWDVEYDLLKEDAFVNCTCTEEDMITTPNGHITSCRSKMATAKRLSDFYKLVSMARYFTLVDYHTEIVYKYVRLTRFERGHNLYQTEQARRVSMRQEGALLFDT